MLRKLFLAILVMVILNIVVTRLLRSQIRIIGNEINKIEATYSSEHTRHSFLIRERQELMRRERIISYAQEHLGMILLKPDDIANGLIVKEIKEDFEKNNTIYTIIDFVSPSMTATETRR